MFHFRSLKLFVGVIAFLIILSKSLSAQGNYGSENVPALSMITIKGDSVAVVQPGPNGLDYSGNNPLILNFRNNNIAFEFEPAESFEFQYFLEGFDRKVSSWQKAGFKEYTNLPARKYILRIRFRSQDNLTGEIEPVAFIIKPMWYFSKVAIAVYLTLFFLIIWVLYEQLNYRFARKQYMLEQIINKRTEDLIIEKEKTEKLLANVLPKNTADELMAKGKAAKIKYNFVTVLFSDIQGFTQIDEEMNPEVLIDELDKFFFHFDSVVGKYRIEKIKTIGDAYMCAGGIPEKNRTNPVEVILAALEMQAYMKKLKETSEVADMKYWDIRIGIHTGTVVAGVIGQKKLSYDIWGDTVNTASRMESSGEGGKINISGTTYEFVKDFFICEHRGKMPVKYKGELDMYFVNGIVPELCDENGEPNSKFFNRVQMIKLQDIEELITNMYNDEAPPNLYFHNPSHIKNIIDQVELLATAENLPEEEYIVLKLAAIFLYTGYISDYEKAMEASLVHVEKVLPVFGFEQKTIKAASNLIINSFNEHYQSLCDKILHDARYDYLGRVDFIKLTDKLLRERTEYGKVTDSSSWINIQRKLLLDHEFMTNTARLLRSVAIEDQVASLQEYNK